MANNIKWTRQHELELVNTVAKGGSLESFSQLHNRSKTATELRLKKIIYENYIGGRSLESISKLLNIDFDKITQYYYSFKDFKEKQNKNIDQHQHATMGVVTNPDAKQIQYGGETLSNVDKLNGIKLKLKKIEIENKILKLIVENKNLTEQLNKLISDKKIDPSVKQLIKILKKAVK